MAAKERNIRKDIMKYCAQAEHCTQDVVLKLKSWNAEEEEMEKIIAMLKKEKFLDDVRYAESFVRDKWKFNHWGKVKIRYELLGKKIAEGVIRASLDQIGKDEYAAGLDALLTAKEKLLAGLPGLDRIKRLLNYADGKGFEDEVTWRWLNAKGYDLET